MDVRGKSVLNIHWRGCCWSWSSKTLATWCDELTHLKRSWCWEGLRVGGEGDDRGWDGWMALPTQWIWVWVSFGSWWWTGRPGVLQSMELQRFGHYWATELNWTELKKIPGPHWGCVRACLFGGQEPSHINIYWDYAMLRNLYCIWHYLYCLH